MSYTGATMGKSEATFPQGNTMARRVKINLRRDSIRTLAARADARTSGGKEATRPASAVKEQRKGAISTAAESATRATTAKEDGVASEPAIEASPATGPSPPSSSQPISCPSTPTPSPTTSTSPPQISSTSLQPPSKPPLHQRLGLLTTLINAYSSTQQRRPLLTNFFAALVIYLLGDLSAQYLGGSDYDPTRTLRNLLIGGIASVPAYKWFLFLSTSFTYPSFALSLLTRVAVNQAVFAPTFNTYYFGMQALLSGASVAETWERVRITVPESFLNSIKLWPAVTAFNFSFVPMQFRAIFAGSIAIGWQSYLSWLNRRAELAKGKDAGDGRVEAKREGREMAHAT